MSSNMNGKSIYLGDAVLNTGSKEVKGGFVEIDGEKFYRISNCDEMSDFFMTIVSDSDHWMFISSNGSLSAGRKDRNNALFPYYTADKINDYRGITGSRTVLLIGREGKTFLWEPFAADAGKIYSISRNLYKSIYCNKIIFEEINLDLGVCFQYGWYNSEQWGFVRKSAVSNLNQGPITVEFLDGISNILPNGVDHDFQNAYSNLLDAYKKSELLEDTGIGLFMLSSIPVDRAEPSESLKATTVWSCGLDQDAKILLSCKQVEHFRKGQPVETETDIRANRGAYFVVSDLELLEGSRKEWMIVAEINQDGGNVANLRHVVKNGKDLFQQVKDDIIRGTTNLEKIVSMADGMQMGSEELCYARHFSNTLFNIMRGGIFIDNYRIDKADFRRFVHETNAVIGKKFEKWLDQLPEAIDYPELNLLAEQSSNPDLIRICHEYLPLTFSRRHGDPSRPWNQFSIETKNSDGSLRFSYQGNWRDIFQNWEALSISFPGFIEGMIAKFLNATTADGYNPYRVTREGIDWESPDPHDPWSYIGYWGDHQIIYLQKFLELSNEFHPGKLDEYLQKEIFAYANVPYRIRPYSEIVSHPKDTITFDFPLNDRIRQLIGKTGADGALLRGGDQEIYRVNLAEKILVTLLAKLSNFIPEAGIWLNTQRPEWNDANNALVGNGTSMVTLCYMRRFLEFWTERFSTSTIGEIHLSEEVATLLYRIHAFFDENKALLGTGFSDHDRRRFADFLGVAGSHYRNSIYEKSFSGVRTAVRVRDLAAFTRLAMEYVDQSIRANRRGDGLYHAYNLISFSDKGISIRHLYEMLEGQVAVLSSGYLSVGESLAVLDSLKSSRMFRQDQYSYLLYPDHQLPLFTRKNIIPPEQVEQSGLLRALVADGDTSILSRDRSGDYHFNGTFRNVSVLQKALDNLENSVYGPIAAEEKERILAVYEGVFDHQSFTGRSGTFYGYEGLGSIYWHMVSKLLLAAQECFFRGVEEGADPAVLGKLKDHYYEIKAGIGLYKSPGLYGAFPTDAYSHTPGNAGAQQPGMTGQVKEDWISRMRELGVHIHDGKISFEFSLLNTDEILSQGRMFKFFDLAGEERQIPLEEGQLGFTLCQVPVLYGANREDRITITFRDGRKDLIPGLILDQEVSAMIFKREGTCTRIEVTFRDPGGQ